MENADQAPKGAHFGTPCIWAGDRYVYFDERAADPANYPPIEFAAHALSQINRFGGHTVRPYSVAEHSLLVTAISARRYKDLTIRDKARLGLACLTHDVHEAFIGDLPTPLKGILPEWRELEAQVEDAVRLAYGVYEVGTEWKAQVKECDLIALATEKDYVMPPQLVADQWSVLEGVSAEPAFNLNEPAARSSQQWAQEFMVLYRALCEMAFAREPVQGSLFEQMTGTRA